MVTHIDYSRSCLECQHCHLQQAVPDYSDLTPGRGLFFGCEFDLWEMDINDTDKERLMLDLAKAQGCKKFKQTAWSYSRYGHHKPLTHKLFK